MFVQLGTARIWHPWAGAGASVGLGNGRPVYLLAAAQGLVEGERRDGHHRAVMPHPYHLRHVSLRGSTSETQRSLVG